MEPSDKQVLRIDGRIVEPSGAPIRSARIGALAAGPKISDRGVSISDSNGEFRIAFELAEPHDWYDTLTVGLAMTLCERWFGVVTGRSLRERTKLGNISGPVELVAVPRPLGRLAVGAQSCSEVRRWTGNDLENSPFTLALVFDAVGDSVFGRFAIQYLTASRSDTGPFRGALNQGRLNLELLEDGTGGCRGPIPLTVAVGPGNALSAGYIGPPTNRCTLAADSVWLVTEPVDFFGYY